MAKPHRIPKKANHGNAPGKQQDAESQAAPGQNLRSSSVGDCPDFCGRAPAIDGRPRNGTVPFSPKDASVPEKPLIIDFSEFDLNCVLHDIEEIHRHNPQRYEMEQLTAIVFEDPVRGICVGYKDLKPDEFWARGHMPGMPLMPGVIMCEAAAQLSSYFAVKSKLMSGMMGFGGMEEIRFRGIVRPGDRFVIVVRLLKARRLMITCEFQCFVDRNLVCEGIIKGIPLPVGQLQTGEAVEE